MFQTFAIRFASSEIAQEYKAEFGKNQAKMQTLLFGGDSTEGSAEADKAASALESLSVKGKETEEQPAMEEKTTEKTETTEATETA